MNLPLSVALEASIEAAVQSGRFASPEEAMEQAARLLRELAQPLPPITASANTSDSIIGSMRDAAEELDAIVEEAMRIRELQAWRPKPEDFAQLDSIMTTTGQSLNTLLDEALQLLFQHWSQQQAELQRLAEREHNNPARKPIWEIVQERMAHIPDEVWQEWPHNHEGINLAEANVCDPVTRQRLMNELGRRMSHLSETATCAGWVTGLEERLPELCHQAAKTGKAQPFGGTVVCPGLAARLLAMRDKLGYWVVPALQGGYEPYGTDKA